jgi:GNAT superfamily N-acetyltransferase
MGTAEPTIEVVPATIDRWELLVTLFASSPGVNRCWCMWPLRPPRTHQPDHHRNMAEMKTRLIDGESPGFLALTEERPVGWCACGPRHRYPQYEHEFAGSMCWAIPCIYIHPDADRKKVAGALIEAATALATRHAATALEGPPAWWLPGDDAAVEKATKDFLENGFTRIDPGARMPQLRRVLA